MKFEFSAGGIVFKSEDKLYILISQHSQHLGWVFPKGLIGDQNHIKDEKKEDTALREVKEETGVNGQILDEIEPVMYWYAMQGIKRKKTVYYFIMKYIDGDITKHDHEMSDVKWVEAEKVEKELTYPSDKDAWRQAFPKIKEFAK